MAYNKTEALTDFANAPNGEAKALQWICRRWIRPPCGSWRRRSWCRRLRGIPDGAVHAARVPDGAAGRAIGAEVGARRLSGEAPFTAVFNWR